jgi:hypothetical protein
MALEDIKPGEFGIFISDLDAPGASKDFPQEVLESRIRRRREQMRKKNIRRGEVKPDYSEWDISQYTFFRENIYSPKNVFYPCCNSDASPLRGFPGSNIVLLDKDTDSKTIMKKAGISQFVYGDVLEYKPANPFDLVIILNPGLRSRDLTRHLEHGGYVMSNNWHDNASQLLDDRDFEGIGTIRENKQGAYLAKGDFSLLKSNQFATYFYVFRKK